MVYVHGHLTVATVCAALELVELFVVCFDDVVEEQNLNKRVTVLGGKEVEQLMFGCVVHPEEFLAEPVNVLDAGQ